ncbi:MAG: hypothetical protein K2J92_01440 [Muribaculaceae bacterium]|nr:hypothetical protein [Bacteroides sp.]MDE6679997.1 hypothetical protein [Muribaculaceae bacterium]MDE6804150.1 hypothetical protein [Muribaculaceae bacterium]MDE6843698.1 hypothetical protein [Muribaculaceae bacterium]MDE7188757.1 hypothetical protein [Muribaculaceae bacterium]
METLRLNFDAEILGVPRTFIIEVPYQNGIVATSEFCPTKLLSGTVDLMAAVRGETLDSFIVDCRRQLIAMSKISEVETDLDIHIGGLMAVVMEHLSRNKRIFFGDLLIYVDCFSLLLKAAGVNKAEIRTIYPRVTKTIVDLYSEYVDSSIEGLPFKGSRSESELTALVAL